MKLNRTNLLAKTHFGFEIYAYVLKQFYPNASLRLSGDSCQPHPNPYNSNRETLIVELRDQLAVHRDLELESFRGNVFDFANLYFKMATLEELYYLLNQVLQLGLKVEPEHDLAWLDLEDDSWRPLISYFQPPVRNTKPAESLSLWEIYNRIKGNTYRSITQHLRSLTDVKQIRAFKAKRFSYVTFAGTFSSRNDRNLLRSSELLVLDFDHLDDLELVKQQLLTDEFFDTEMLFVSPSGTGLKWVIRHCDPTNPSHNQFFKAVTAYLKATYDIEADPSGKDLSRACFLPHDPEVYLNPRHRVLVKSYEL